MNEKKIDNLCIYIDACRIYVTICVRKTREPNSAPGWLHILEHTGGLSKSLLKPERSTAIQEGNGIHSSYPVSCSYIWFYETHFINILISCMCVQHSLTEGKWSDTSYIPCQPDTANSVCLKPIFNMILHEPHAWITWELRSLSRCNVNRYAFEKNKRNEHSVWLYDVTQPWWMKLTFHTIKYTGQRKGILGLKANLFNLFFLLLLVLAVQSYYLLQTTLKL